MSKSVFCVCFPAGWVHVLSHVDLRQPGTIAERILIEQYIGTSCVVRVAQDSLFEKPGGPPPERSLREDNVITENEAREVLELAREVWDESVGRRHQVLPTPLLEEWMR